MDISKNKLVSVMPPLICCQYLQNWKINDGGLNPILPVWVWLGCWRQSSENCSITSVYSVQNRGLHGAQWMSEWIKETWSEGEAHKMVFSGLYPSSHSTSVPPWEPQENLRVLTNVKYIGILWGIKSNGDPPVNAP